MKPLKTKVNNIKQVRIVPQATCYIIEVVYEKEVKKVDLKNNTYLSIDLGVNNFATCINNMGRQPFIINGKPLKSINQYFNKKRAMFLSKQTIGKDVKKKKDKVFFRFSKRIRRLTFKRNNKVLDYIHKTSRFIVNYCIEYKIKTIVIGNNKRWKQRVNIGKRNNQNFVNIPFNKLIKQIEYKAEEVGIEVIISEESYTSKCSFIDFESIKRHVRYAGQRISRGLFRTAEGLLLNADVNGAYNILRKVVPKVFADGIEVVGLQPIIINNFVNDYE